MAADLHRSNRDRLKAAAGVAACHALLGYALVTGFHYEVVERVDESLKLIRIAALPPPPPVEEPVPAKATRTPEGAAAPPSLKANPSPVVVPPPKIRLPVPPRLPTVDKATPLPPGSASTAGNASIPGIGSGTGGQGSGTGSGGSGTGSGGGGASKPVRLRGSIDDGDYPASAREAGGSVAVVFTVGSDGRVSGCRVARSSGRPDLDATTCRLIEARFVYRPATDADGRPVQSVLSTVFTYSWRTGGRRSRD
jgi:protein TonB